MSTEHKTPKKKDPSIKKKSLKFKEIKKPIFVGSIIVVAAIAGIVGGFIIINLQQGEEENVLICGIDGVVQAIDPLRLSTGIDLFLIDQVAEGLFDYNQSTPETPIVNNLATGGVWSADYLNFTCTLRTGVKFHDGTPFNATAVKWNFDRIYRFIENEPWGLIWWWAYMYLNSEGQPIINRTEVLDTYTVRFVLSTPYIPLKALLTGRNSYIVSPTSTPADDYITLNSSKLIGTGPFKLASCVRYHDDPYWQFCANSSLVANSDYWGGKPQFDKIIIVPLWYDDVSAAWESEKLSFAVIEDLETLEQFTNMSGVNVLNKTDLGIWQIGLNNKIMNVTMRKAISFAFNYTWYFDVYRDGETPDVIARSPLPKEMLYSNWEDFDTPYYNITRARQTLIDASWNGTTGLMADNDTSPGNPWELKALSNFPLVTYNITYPYDSWSSGNFSLEIQRNLKQIGVKVELLGLPRLEWWLRMISGELEFSIYGWGATIDDPVDVLNPQYSTKADGISNSIHFNDTLVQQWMDNATKEPDPIAREQLYYQIQERMVEVLYPCIWLRSPVSYTAWASNVRGIPLVGTKVKILFKDGYFA